jgi:membrane protein DedA with SNARE-associated domain
MSPLYETILTIICGVIGLTIGFYIGKWFREKHEDSRHKRIAKEMESIYEELIIDED